MVQEIIELLLSLPQQHPVEILPPELDTLFARLGAVAAAAEAYAIEDRIWELWISHPDPAAAERMNSAIAAIARRNYDEAQALLDDLVRAEPLWPEAWNKRATLAFLRGRDEESLRNIRRTLLLEPRHFGALSGLAQICLRQGEPPLALLAFDAALKLNPHLAQVRVAADPLRQQLPQSIH